MENEPIRTQEKNVKADGEIKNWKYQLMKTGY
jgi:hypothetical protein